MLAKRFNRCKQRAQAGRGAMMVIPEAYVAIPPGGFDLDRKLPGGTSEQEPAEPCGWPGDPRRLARVFSCPCNLLHVLE